MPDLTAALPQGEAVGFPEAEDWQGWIDIWCREDDGTIDCVPDCLRSADVMCHIGEHGRLIDPDMLPSTPYGVARFVHAGPRPPWCGSGITPTRAKELWQAEIAKATPVAEPQPAAAPTAEPEVVAARLAAGKSDLYIIKSAGGPIKIGISCDPHKRLKGLQTAHPWKLEILCIVPGGAMLETEYHERFAAHRLTGEWFEPHEDILAEVERLTCST